MSRLLSSITDCLSQLLNSVPPPMHISYPGPRYILTSLISASRHGSSFMSLCYTRWLLYWAREEIWKSHKLKVNNFTDSHFFFILKNTTLNNHSIALHSHISFNCKFPTGCTTSFTAASLSLRWMRINFLKLACLPGYQIESLGFGKVRALCRFFKVW